MLTDTNANFNFLLLLLKQHLCSFMINLRLFFVIIIILIIEGCASAPRFTSSYNKQYEIQNFDDNLERYNNYSPLETVIGVASFYADKYHGRITYGGEIYDMNKVSAAHSSYPMNTIVRVTNLSNNKSIILRINDRMPIYKDRIIDLSYEAAKRLDFIKDGLTKVKLEVLEWGNGKK